jgi:hypothetical protein
VQTARPLYSKSGHVQCTSACPLWANSGHFACAIAMSAFPHWPTCLKRLLPRNFGSTACRFSAWRCRRKVTLCATLPLNAA